MIKKYTVHASTSGVEAGLNAINEIECNIILEPDNGQGMTLDKFGNLLFTLDNNNIRLFAAGTWIAVSSE